MVTIRHVVCDRESYFVKDTATALDAAEYMADRRIGAVCVLDSDEKLCGIFSERDLLNRVVVLKLDPAGVPIRDVMSEPRAVIDCWRLLSSDRVPALEHVELGVGERSSDGPFAAERRARAVAPG